MKDKKNLIWCVKLTRMQLTVLYVEATDRCEHFFYKKETAEKWLTNHGFVYGKFRLFKDTPESYWFHQKDCRNDYVLVDIFQVEIDNMDKTEKWVEDLAYIRGRELETRKYK